MSEESDRVLYAWKLESPIRPSRELQDLVEADVVAEHEAHSEKTEKLRSLATAQARPIVEKKIAPANPANIETEKRGDEAVATFWMRPR